MLHHRSAALFSSLVLALGVLAASPSPARADSPAVALAVDAAGTRVDSARLRRRLADVLGVPVVTQEQASAGPTLGLLSVSVTNRGRAVAIRFVPNDGVRYAVMVEVLAEGRPDARGLWMVEPCASVVRSSNERRAATEPAHDYIDPWITSHTVPANDGPEARTSINPWAGTPRPVVRVWVTELHVAEEIENPWAEAVSRYREEQAHRPAPRAH